MGKLEVLNHLEQYNLENKLVTLLLSTASVSDAALAINCLESQIAKSITFKNKHSNDAIMIITSGNTKVSNKLFKEEFNYRPTMLKKEEVKFYTNHDVGGVCPFGIKYELVKIYLDCSLKQFSKVYVAGGDSNSLVGLTIVELETASLSNGWVNVCE